MATYRQVYISFWQDKYILDLNPEGKLLYIYLLTNTKTTQCGIYELPLKIIEFETGLNEEIIETYIRKFIADKKILYSYETAEIFILNWLKYNSIDSPKVISCIKKELMQVKNKEYVALFIQIAEQLGYPIDELKPLLNTLSIPYPYPIDTLSIPYEYPIDKVSIDYGEEKEKEKENNNIYYDDDYLLYNSDLQNLAEFFSKNIHPITPTEFEDLKKWLEHFSKEVIEEAIKEAVRYNKRSMKYINKILIRWDKLGLKTLEAVQAYIRDWQDSKNKEGLKDGKYKGDSEDDPYAGIGLRF